jgi:hypothetical protein
MVARELGDQLAPGPPVLGPAVQQDERRALPGLGHVEPDVADLHVTMADAGDGRDGVEVHGVRAVRGICAAYPDGARAAHRSHGCPGRVAPGNAAGTDLSVAVDRA